MWVKIDIIYVIKKTKAVYKLYSLKKNDNFINLNSHAIQLKLHQN